MFDSLHDAQPETSHPPSPLRRIFYGPDGLRAGWSLLLFALPFAVLYGVMALARHAQQAPSRRTVDNQINVLETALVELISFAVVAGTTFLVSLVERRPFGTYGLGRGTPDANPLFDLGKGLAWGVVFLSLLVETLRLTGLIVFDGIALDPLSALGYALSWFAAFLFVGLFEEFLFRGFVQYTAARGISGLVRAIVPRSRHSHAIGFWSATLLFSVGLFALLHKANQGESPVGLAAVAAAGLTFAYSLWRTGTLWWAVGFHAAWDWAQSFLFGVADSGSLAQGHLFLTHPAGAAIYSGGATGPEGSILVFPTLALTAVIIHLTLPRRDYPLTPSQQPPTVT
ncbi:CPBP family intramembrane metalloprotease [Granulicella sp. WH15]|uniref:CPBP family intramembrane glutamic endopeptidase n=1 Tax=Granulicella sp. WH15 TaxID=2602070 RepID=UPI001366B2E0|nr:CPBP family intramembrane glutamic endopeptidase [Granulicella sp. WH15]QHN04436.1 CPBP family intramembrane metalloprotease [Granulicella sp. WH15]